MMRKHLLIAMGLMVAIVAFVYADQIDATLSQEQKMDDKEVVTDSPAEENLAAQHDVDGPDYRADCLTCHSDVLTEQTQDPRIPSFHQAMMPYTPGYNPAHGPSDDVCVQCHRFVDIVQDSGGALRKQVDPQMCALCHGPSGPGHPFYER